MRRVLYLVQSTSILLKTKYSQLQALVSLLHDNVPGHTAEKKDMKITCGLGYQNSFVHFWVAVQQGALQKFKRQILQQLKEKLYYPKT